MKRSALALGAIALAAATPARADWDLRLEAGSAYDSNVHRAERIAGEDPEAAVPVVAAPLVRAGARLALSTRPRERQHLSLDAFAGAKAFAGDDAQSENVAILAARGRYSLALGDAGAQASAFGAYYDAIGVGGGPAQIAARSFRLARGGLSVSLAPDREDRVSARLGGVGFDYKPDASSSFTGPFFGLLYRRRLWLEEGDADTQARLFELQTGYTVERRAFDGPAYTDGCPPGAPPIEGCFLPTAIGRRDLNHRAFAGLQLTGDRIYAAQYQVEINDSNSYGQSLVRHRLDLTLTTALPGAVFATLRTTLLYNQFLDPLLIDADLATQSFVSIDDENRNGFSIHLLRQLTDTFAIEARYAFSTNELGTREVAFRRHTGYLGLIVGMAGNAQTAKTD